jgi:hypothetical protein
VILYAADCQQLLFLVSEIPEMYLNNSSFQSG